MTVDRDALIDQHATPLMFFDPPDQFDQCVLGVGYRCGMEPVVIYDQECVVAALIDGGMTHEAAMEWFDYNIAGTCTGEHTPMLMQKVSND